MGRDTRMIDIATITDKDIGKWVNYTPKKEFGRIKSWNDSGIFVVYNAGGDWVNFKDYTAAHTRPEDLEWLKIGNISVVGPNAYQGTKKVIDETLTLCDSCWCMTKMINGKCGKCKASKL